MSRNDGRAAGRSLRETLAGIDEVTRHLDEKELAGLLDPAGYLGSTHAFIDRVLRAHQRGQA